MLIGIERLQRLTDGRLKYFINGPSVPSKWAELISLVDLDNLTLTDARLTASPPTKAEIKQFPGLRSNHGVPV